MSVFRGTFGRIRKPKAICRPKEIIPQNFNSLESAVSEESSDIQTKNAQTQRDTHVYNHTLKLTSRCFRGRRAMRGLPIPYLSVFHILLCIDSNVDR